MAKSGLYVFKQYFGEGTAETEKDFLERAFLPSKEYLEIIEVPAYAPRLIVGKKGSGKSALVKFIQFQMKEAKLPSLLIGPKDIRAENISNSMSLGDLTREYEKAISKTIAIKIGKDKSGFFASKSDDILIEGARLV